MNENVQQVPKTCQTCIWFEPPSGFRTRLGYCNRHERCQLTTDCCGDHYLILE